MDTASVDKLGKHTIFYSVYNLLRQEQTPDEAAQLRIDDARKFLEEGVKSLESIISPNGPYYITDTAIDVMQTLCGKTRGATKEEVKSYIAKVRGFMEQLRTLRTSPLEFYKEKHDALLEALHNMSNLYTENHRVLKCYENAE